MYRRWPLAALVVALALITAPAAFGASNDPPAEAGWHGREIRDPLPQRVRGAVARFPRGWSAGTVDRGTGYPSRNGSRRVREVQRRLVRRGYRPGPVDGRYGARTRAAVIWFQTKHGLPRTGRVDAPSVATMRQTPQARHTPTTRNAPSPAGEEAGALARTTPQAPPGQAGRTWLVLLAVMIMVGFAGIVWWVRAELRARPLRPADVRHEKHRAQLTAVTPPPAHAPVDVVGYIAVARGKDRDREIDTTAQIIGSWCESRRWHLSQLVHDVEPASGRITDRPGLAYALDQIAAGRVAGLVLAHLGDVTRSVTELAQLLGWMNTAGAFMIALDYELGTSTAAGDLAAAALMEIGEWERGRTAGRTQPALRAMHTQGAPANRASVRDDLELRARISAMRARGLSLQAISDTLNAERVPTPRGGTQWRPLSVYAAIGYTHPPAKPAGGLQRPKAARTNGTNTQERWDNEPT
jgi:peptidoglycan hydrolase-like protein with peptidoglycan-binding domain